MKNQCVEKHNCPHCGDKVYRKLGDLSIKLCCNCGKMYGIDDLGGYLKVGEICEMTFNGKNFVCKKPSKR